MHYRLAVMSGVLVTAAALSLPNARRAIFLSGSHSQASNNTQEIDDSRLISFIGELRSENENQRSTAKTNLINLSKASAHNREVVIKELLSITDTSDRGLNFLKDPAHYWQWEESTKILGSIRATEAINNLIRCLDCNDGKSGLSVQRFPATAALVSIGEKAVPNLSEAIQDQRPMYRYLSSLALTQIHGDQAKRVLTAAMRREKDKNLASTMRNFLQRWNDSTQNQD